MENRKQIDSIADSLIKFLSRNGFVIQRYDAYSTDSVYLKLDFGVSNSIRISDHLGKEKLQYRYNIIIGGKDNIVEEKYIRYFFNENSIEMLANQILLDRMEKIKKYGRHNYLEYMKNNIRAGQNAVGFWKQSRLIAGEFSLLGQTVAVFHCRNGHIEVFDDTV